MDMARVLCVGVNPAFDITLTVDGLDADRVNRVTGEFRTAAGKAANVASALAEMGAEVCLSGFYGAETWAEWRALFARRTARVEQLPIITAGSTRQNITLLADGSTIKINRSGDPVSAADIAKLGERITSWLRKGDVAVFTGSIPPGMSKAQYITLMKTAGTAGALIAVDSDALSREELLGIEPWLYKPNAHELAGMCGANAMDDEVLIKHAQQLSQSGVGTVLLTLGSCGLAAITQEETVRVHARRIKVVNTVGAGDAALAAYIEAHLSGCSVYDCAHAAAAAGERAVASEH